MSLFSLNSLSVCVNLMDLSDSRERESEQGKGEVDKWLNKPMTEWLRGKIEK